jgi:hypothetical protein
MVYCPLSGDTNSDEIASQWEHARLGPSQDISPDYNLSRRDSLFSSDFRSNPIHTGDKLAMGFSDLYLVKQVVASMVLMRWKSSGGIYCFLRGLNSGRVIETRGELQAENRSRIGSCAD